MNLCKRACLYSIRKKGKTLTLLAFLLVMATLMLTCLSIQSATETANANIKKALLGYFTINAKTLENGIPEDTVSQILDVDGLSGRYTLRSYTYATYFDADGNLLEINTEGAAQVPEGYENAGRVVANSNSQEDSYFTDGGFEPIKAADFLHLIASSTKKISPLHLNSTFVVYHKGVPGRRGHHRSGKSPGEKLR